MAFKGGSFIEMGPISPEKSFDLLIWWLEKVAIILLKNGGFSLVMHPIFESKTSP